MDSTIGARYRVLVKRKRGARYASFSTVFYFRTSIGLKWKTGVLYQKSKKSKKIFWNFWNLIHYLDFINIDKVSEYNQYDP